MKEFQWLPMVTWDGSDGKASVYNAGDPGSIPGLGRSLGEGNGILHIYVCVCVWSETLLSHKKERDTAICSNMDGPTDYCVKWVGRKAKGKYHVLSHTWNLKYNTNELIDKIKTNSQTENKLMVPKGGSHGEQPVRSLGVRYIHYYI